MQQILKFWKITFIFIFSIAILGCTTNKNTLNNDNFVTVQGTAEGIRIDFSNIPEETSHLFIGLWESGRDNELQTNISFFDDNLGYRGNILSDLKKTMSLICPFVKEGQEYIVRIAFITIEGNSINEITANAVAGGGTYLINKPVLSFNTANTHVTLSEMPVFSNKVIFSSDGRLEFTNYVIMDDGSTYGGGWSHWNELTYPVRETLNATQEHFGFRGEFPVNAFVHCWLIAGNVEWSVAIAKAEENVLMIF